MEFKKKKPGNLSFIGKLLIKIVIIILLLLAVFILINKIDFPSPNKKIEKVIPNESFKVIK